MFRHKYHWRWQALIVSSACHEFLYFLFNFNETVNTDVYDWVPISCHRGSFIYIYILHFYFINILFYIRNEKTRSMLSINGLSLEFWNWIFTIKHTNILLYSTAVKLVHTVEFNKYCMCIHKTIKINIWKTPKIEFLNDFFLHLCNKIRCYYTCVS